MTNVPVVRRGSATLLVALTLAACQADPEQGDAAQSRRQGATTGATTAPATPAADDGTHQGLLYGRVITDDGTTYEGRLRWGGDEEALWGNTFNGAKAENPWARYAPPESTSIGIFGVEIARGERPREVSRPFMARFGDIAYIEPRGRDLHVILRSDTEVVLDRYGADDLADGLRVWDATHGVVDIDEWRIRVVELLPAAAPGDGGPYPLYGTVSTRRGTFTGPIQWDRRACLGSDEITGNTAEGELTLRFDDIRSIERASGDSSRVTLVDGRELVLSGTREVGENNRGVYVDDPRYGRVLVSWDAFERLDFAPGGTGPAYDDFPLGNQLTGAVTTRSGRRLAGRVVYDLDESETTDSLDAPLQGVDYTIFFGLIASIEPRVADARGAPRARVALHSGEELQLELAGDLGQDNAGVLVFSAGDQEPEYVPWEEVERIDLASPAAMYPPIGPR